MEIDPERHGTARPILELIGARCVSPKGRDLSHLKMGTMIQMMQRWHLRHRKRDVTNGWVIQTSYINQPILTDHTPLPFETVVYMINGIDKVVIMKAADRKYSRTWDEARIAHLVAVARAAEKCRTREWYKDPIEILYRRIPFIRWIVGPIMIWLGDMELATMERQKATEHPEEDASSDEQSHPS